MIWNQTRFWMHFPIGVIAPLLSLTHEDGEWYAALFISLFIFYQLTEDLAKMFILKDKNKPAFESYIDVQGTIAGIPVGCLILFLIQML